VSLGASLGNRAASLRGRGRGGLTDRDEDWIERHDGIIARVTLAVESTEGV